MARATQSSLSIILMAALAGCGGGSNSPAQDSADRGPASSPGGVIVGSSSSSSSSGAPGASSSGSPAAGFSGDAAQGQALFAAQCQNCHNDEMDGTFTKGLRAFDVNNFTYPSSTAFPGHSADSVEQLAKFIGTSMADAETCDQACVDDLAAYLWSYKDDSTAPVVVNPVEFDDDGLKLELACSQDQSDLNIKINNPNGYTAIAPSSYFTPVSSTPAGLSTPDMESVVKRADNELLVIEGGGEDIWEKAIYFSGISTSVNDGKLDLTLEIGEVANVSHDFAKVGILASSTDDLSGDLLFLHWSGNAGLAEDSGSGTLDQYEQLAESPTDADGTPTPTTLRLAYENGQLRIGGCYDCDSPVMQDAADINFEPKRAFIVVSSHATDTIEAQVEVTDAFAPTTESETVYESVVSCDDAESGIELAGEHIAGMDELEVEVYQANQLISQHTFERAFSPTASCAAQEQLLEPKVRRLSQAQIKNALTDTFGRIFPADVWPDMADGALLIGMNTMADKLNVNSINFERLYQSSRRIVRTLIDEHSEVSSCAQSSSSACVTELALEYGPLVWRRPLTDDEVAGLYDGIEATANNEEAIEFVFNSLILSSNFLFRSELGYEADGFAQLGNYEIASLLSFTVWNSTPDKELLELADKSTPFTEVELKAQIDRMFADPRANTALMEVYKDYLKLDLVLSQNKAEEFQFSDEVRRDLLTSAEKTLLDNIAGSNHFLDVFAGDSYYVNSTTAEFFNTTSSSKTLEPVVLDSTKRSGMLNHPAFLAVHSTLTQSGIVQRGVFALEQLLCQEIPDPPGDVMGVPVPADVDPATTSERRLLQITHSSQAACQGCHRFIDPAGFGFENFDAVGRYRTTEKDGVVIDASGILEGIGEATLSYNNSAEYARELTGSPQMNHCVSQRFLEHYLSQELSHDSCELKKYQSLLSESDASVKDLLYALVSLESFSKRQLNP